MKVIFLELNENELKTIFGGEELPSWIFVNGDWVKSFCEH